MNKQTISCNAQSFTAVTDKQGRNIVVIRGSGNTQAVFNRSYVDAIAKGLGKTTAKLNQYAKMFKVSFDKIDLTAGEIVKGSQGEDITITKDHSRYENLNIELREEFFAMSMNADAVGEAIASQFNLPVAAPIAAPVERVNAVIEAPVVANVPAVEDAQHA